MDQDRRTLLKAMAVGSSGLALGGAAWAVLPGSAAAAAGTPLPPNKAWMTALGTSLDQEHDYRPRVEGRIPAGLEGTLYRNGPGLFERDGYRKAHLLDGDGMIQAFDFTDGGVRYRNRFVRTEKFKEEEEAGAYLNATWTTRAPGGALANLGGPGKSQAGVTTLVKDGRLLAFDEVNPPYALDPRTLETVGPYEVAAGLDEPDFKAHTKTDVRTGDWVLFGLGYGPTNTLHAVVRAKDGRVKAHRTIEAPRSTYIHDFFATERYVVFVLHPVEFSPFSMLMGFQSFTDSLVWRPEGGNLVMVVEKSGEAPPLVVEAPAAFMWHAFNAYERGNTLIADFVGYDAPDHFIGDNPAFKAIMRGERGDAKHPGTVRRYVIDLEGKSLRQEILAKDHHEFPAIDLRVACHAHRVGYVAYGTGEDWLLNGVARIDFESGRRDVFSFGPDHFAGEPIFVPAGNGEGEGWLLAQAQDGRSGNSLLAVFDAGDVAAGPVARVLLEHHVPLSFHGWWQAA